MMSKQGKVNDRPILQQNEATKNREIDLQFLWT